MEKKQIRIDRRNFLKTAGAAGLTAALVSNKGLADLNEPNAPVKPQDTKPLQLPRRKLGKTGVEVPVLALGTMFDLVENQIILRRCVDLGVTYWDTSYAYAGGNSELGIGKFLEKNPQVRKNLFIVSKASGAKSAKEVEDRLQESLKRMNTDYIDLYYGVHVLNDISQLKDELKPWAEGAKKRGLIHFFGFSTHSNMAKNLTAASNIGWVDAVLASYNFRLTKDPEMQAAIEACRKAGVGLTAMKTLGLRIETEDDKKLAQHFLQKNFTEAQAKIKLVLEDERISAAAVGMKSIANLTENVAAVLDKTKLSQADKDAMQQYADATCTSYCAGCSNICNAALPETPYVRDIMRHLMYYNSYGEKDMAKELFAQIPTNMRSRLLSSDYSLAEARCPQHLPIAKLVAEAVSKLA